MLRCILLFLLLLLPPLLLLGNVLSEAVWWRKYNVYLQGNFWKQESEKTASSSNSVVSSLFPAATPCSVTWKACPSTRSNLDSSLVCLTRNFADLMKRSAQGVLDLNYACRILNVPKRRLYDVTNALEGAHLITKKMKNSVQWLWVKVDVTLR